MKNLRLLILDRYIMRKFLGTYVFAIAMIIIIMVIFDAAENIDKFIEAHVSLGQAFSGYYLNFIPYFVNQFSGLFTFIAVIFFTSKMAYNTEIIAILSSGVSFRRMLWPYFVSAFIIAMLSLSLNMFLIPNADARRINFENNYMKKNRGPAYDQYIYRQTSPGTYVFVRDFNIATSTAGYMVIESYEDGNMVSSLEAQAVKYDSLTGRWKAPRYIVRTFSGEMETFKQMDQPLDTMINLSSQEMGRVDQMIKTLTTPKLRKFIQQQKIKGSDMVTVFEIENYNRWAYPISTFVLTLIGVSLSSRKVRGGTGLHIGVGIGLCFSYIVLMKFASEFAKGGFLPAWLAVWSPNVIYAMIGIFLYRKAPK